MTANLSPALEELVRRRDQLQAACQRALVANKAAHEKEANLEATYKEELAKRFLFHRAAHEEGQRPMSERDAASRADVDCADLYHELVTAKAVRRASAEALSVWAKDLETITALANAHNRELRVLGG